MKNKIYGALLATGGGIAWGLSGSVGQYLFQYQGMDSRWLVPIRLFFAGVVMAFLCAIYYKKAMFAPICKEYLLQLVLYAVLGVGSCQFFYFLSIQYSSAAVGTIMQDFAPAMILLCLCIAKKKLPSLKELTAVLLAFVGVFFITTHGKIGKTAIPLIACVAGLLSSVSVTFYNVGTKRLLQRFPVPVLQAWAFLFSGFVLGVVFRIWRFSYIPNFIGVLGIIFVVLVGNVIAFTFYMKGVSLIGAKKAILYGFSEPITAALIAKIFLHTHFTIYDALGFIAIFSMIALISHEKS